MIGGMTIRRAQHVEGKTKLSNLLLRPYDSRDLTYFLTIGRNIKLGGW